MANTLRLAGIVPESIVDGPGIRFTIFVQGCPHHCPDCHNPDTHDFSAGTDTPVSQLLAEMDKHPYLTGITLSGGEPFCQAEVLFSLAKAMRARGKHVMAYTGYTFEELLSLPDPFVRSLLEQLNLLVDGKFILSEKSLELRFRGSLNQRILDVPASLLAEKPIWAERYR